MNFEEWAERAKLYIQYIGALGIYKLNVAKAELESAKAAGEMATVRAKHVVINQLQRDLRRLNAARGSFRSKQSALQKKVSRAALLAGGRKIRMTSFTSAWSAYVVFERNAILTTGDNLFKIAAPKSALNKSNFIPCSSRNRQAIDAPDEIENAIGLFDWMHDQRFIAKSGSSAHRVVAQLYGEINKIATEEIKLMKSALAKMKDETYVAWQMVAILGVEKTVVTRSIEEAGTARR